MAREQRPFTQLTFEATDACNLDCVHCLREPPTPRRRLDLKLAQRVLEEGRALGMEAVSLTGGEPTIHPHFLDLIALIARHDYHFSFATNGWTFHELHRELEPYRAGGTLTAVLFSLDGARAETHDAMRRPDSFRRVMQAVSVCHAQGLDFCVQLAVSKLNLQEMEEFALLGAMLGAKQVHFAFLQPTPRAVEADLVPTPDEVRRARNVVERLSKALKCEVTPTPGLARPHPWIDCPTLRAEVVNIDCGGRLTFCCQLSGLAGAEGNESDIIADLNEVPLVDALAELLDRIADFRKARLTDVAEGRLQPTDEFACQYCARKLGKLGWLADRPDSLWAPRV